MKTFVSIMLLLILVCLPQVTAFAQWVQTNGPNAGPVSCFAINGTDIFAGTGGGVFRSTNSGANWTLVNTGIANSPIQSLAVIGGNLFASTPMNGVFLSTNNGTSWIAANEGLSYHKHNDTTRSYVEIDCFAASGTNLFAAGNGGVFLSTNNGTSWTAVNNGLPTKDIYNFPQIRCLASSGQNLFAGTEYGVFLTKNNGTSWMPVNTGLPSNSSIGSLAIVDTNLFAGTWDGVFVSTNNGTSWTSWLWDFYFGYIANGTDLFAPGGGGVVSSTDRGASWIPVTTRLPRSPITALAVSGTNLFAGTTGDGVWRWPLSETKTDVESRELLPASFVLAQNYPNPFNPSTTIRYGLPHKSQVSLMVYNTLGQLVSQLLSSEQEAGYYEVRFDASGLSSGVYIYRLQAGTYAETRKLLLLR